MAVLDRAQRELPGRHVPVPMIGLVRIPSQHQVVYLGGLAALAAVGAVEWPIVLLITAGSLAVDQSWSFLARRLASTGRER
jgi:hypothetical protein